MRKEWKRIITYLAAVTFVFIMSTISAQAAAVKCYHWADDPAVKAGGAWFRYTLNYDENTGDWIRLIEMSKTSAKSGFSTIIDEAELSNGFATDGTTLYYVASNVLKAYTVKTGEVKAVKKLTVPSDAYIEFSGFYNKKIWLIARVEKYGVPALFSYNVATKKIRTEKKKCLCFNPAAVSRYLVIAEGTAKLKKSGIYNLKVYDKNTGKTKVITKNGFAWNYASGGGGTSEYAPMGKWIMYGEFNKQKNAWEIREYKFKNKKVYVRKTLNKGQKLKSIMWVGNGVRYGLTTDKENVWDNSRLVTAK